MSGAAGAAGDMTAGGAAAVGAPLLLLLLLLGAGLTASGDAGVMVTPNAPLGTRAALSGRSDMLQCECVCGA